MVEVVVISETTELARSIFAGEEMVVTVVVVVVVVIVLVNERLRLRRGAGACTRVASEVSSGTGRFTVAISVWIRLNSWNNSRPE